MLRKYSVLMYENGKIRPAETVSGKWWQRGVKEDDGWGEFNYDIL
jgi:hypothetical protein